MTIKRTGPMSGKDARLLAKEKLKALTLEEKVSLLTAADFWRTKGIPEKGIPYAKTTDGPNGARGSIFVGGTKAALFPCGISLASTWNKDLLHAIGREIALEAKARSANILLAPTVCLHRHPLGGRNFESFSEDPLLTGKLAAQYVRGVQEQGIAATIKHFVTNEQETNRMTVDSQVTERALRELYLRPFEIAVREASPWAFMTSYNRVNGVHASMNNHTLREVLRGDWGFDGTVMSDWTGTNSTAEGIKAGQDLEFPHSTKWRFDKAVQAVKDGKLTVADIDEAAENALTLVLRTKGDDLSVEAAEREDDRAETRALIREAGVQGLTLLKNEGSLLPINPKTTTVAVIGPNANRAIAGGGGSASLNPYYNTIPLDSIRSAVAEATDKTKASAIPYALGCPINKWAPVATPFCRTRDGKPGLTLDWYAGDEVQGSPVETEHRTEASLLLFDSTPVDKTGPKWSAVATTYLTPTKSGRHTISLMSVGPGRLYVDGKLQIDLWKWEETGDSLFGGSAEAKVQLDMTVGKVVEVRVELSNEVLPESKKKEVGATHLWGGCRLGYLEQVDVDYLQEAVEAAKAADVAIVVVGVDGEWESEGYDRKTLDLPLDGSQDRLIEAVFAANPRTVVVNQTGSPVSMPWADRVPAILQAWYQGQEAGNALADVLFGAQNPSGKLPATFPKRLEDTPAFHNWPGENLEVVYGEGLYIGYRHYERSKIAPLFPFGYGLSYTTFAYGPAKISGNVLGSGAGSVLEVTVPVTNTGRVAGAETVQAYVRDDQSRLPRPEKELAAFDKVFLQPGETKEARLQLDKYSVGYYDTSIQKWIAEAGTFQVLVGASSADIRSMLPFAVEESFTWVF